MGILKAFFRWLYKTLNLLTETILVNVLIVDILSNTKKTLTPSTFTMSDVLIVSYTLVHTKDIINHQTESLLGQ